MKKLIFLTIFSMFFLAADCDRESEFPADPVPGSVSINFKGLYDGMPLVMFADEYSYEEGMNLKFQLFQFYISNVELVLKFNGVETVTPLSDVELVSFKEIVDEAAALKGITFTYDQIYPTVYSEIRFGLGLTEAQNNTNPSDYTPPHPLDDHYWSAALGYVFTKIEGNADFDGDGVYTNEGKLTFHAGKNNLFRQLSFPINLEVKEDATTPVEFTVDLKKVLSNGPTDFLDFREVTQDHSNNPAVYEGITNRLETAITLD